MSDRTDAYSSPPAVPDADPRRSPLAHLGAAVRARRGELGLLQADVAALAGCSNRFVHTLEHGKPTLRLDKVLDVLEVLGLDLAVVPGGGRLRGGDRGGVDG